MICDGTYVGRREIGIRDCAELVKVPYIEGLKRLEISYCPNLIEIAHNDSLERLHLHECDQLTIIPAIDTLKHIYIGKCPRINELPLFPNIESVSLNKNKIRFIPVPSIESLILNIDDYPLPNLPNLEYLAIHGKITKIPKFKNLKRLEISGKIKKIPTIETLKTLRIGCYAKIPYLPNLTRLIVVNENIKLNPNNLPRLTDLDIMNTSVKKIGYYKNLTRINVCNCRDLVEIDERNQICDIRCLYCDKLIRIPNSISKRISYCYLIENLEKLKKCKALFITKLLARKILKLIPAISYIYYTPGYKGAFLAEKHFEKLKNLAR